MEAILKVNCPSIRRRLEEAGLTLCPCCEFDGSVWLVCSDLVDTANIHGEGYPIEEMGIEKVEDALRWYELDRKQDCIDCGYDVEIFIENCKKIKNIC